MHVANIAPQFQNVPGSFQVQATNTIQDANGAAVSGAAVTVDITLPNGSHVIRTKPTNTNGRASVSVRSSLTGVYTFTVTNVTKTAWTYDPAANAETSDTITVP
jgi:hypothetical protein